MNAREFYKLAYRYYRLETRVFEIKAQIEDCYETMTVAPLMSKGGSLARDLLTLRHQLKHDPTDIRVKAKLSWNNAEAIRYPSLLARALAIECFGLSADRARLYQSGLWPKAKELYRRSLVGHGSIFTIGDKISRYVK